MQYGDLWTSSCYCLQMELDSAPTSAVESILLPSTEQEASKHGKEEVHGVSSSTYFPFFWNDGNIEIWIFWHRHLCQTKRSSKNNLYGVVGTVLSVRTLFTRFFRTDMKVTCTYLVLTYFRTYETKEYPTLVSKGDSIRDRLATQARCSLPLARCCILTLSRVEGEDYLVF